jgi:hypothetical protein
MRAESRSGKADVLQFRLSETMCAYIALLQDCSVARAACTVLEERVSAEARKREAVKNEFADLSEILDISKMRPMLPALLPLEKELVFKDEQDLVSRIRAIEKEILVIDSGKPISGAESSAAFEISRAAHLQIQKSSQDKNAIQSSITSLSAIVRQMETYNQQSESENRKLHIQMQQLENEQRQQEIEAQEATNGQNAAHEGDLQRMSDTLKGIKRQIDSTARNFEVLKEETEELRQELVAVETHSELPFDFESGSNYEEDSDIFEPEPSGTDAYLVGKRDLLMNEVENLQREVTDFRVESSERQRRLKKRIEQLRGKEAEYRKMLGDYFEGNSSDSEISPAMTKLLKHIDANMVDLAEGNDDMFFDDL